MCKSLYRTAWYLSIYKIARINYICLIKSHVLFCCRIIRQNKQQPNMPSTFKGSSGAIAESFTLHVFQLRERTLFLHVEPVEIWIEYVLSQHRIESGRHACNSSSQCKHLITISLSQNLSPNCSWD